MGKRARDLFAFGRGTGTRRVTEKSGVARRMLGISALFVLVFFLMLLYLGGYALTRKAVDFVPDSLCDLVVFFRLAGKNQT